MKKICFLFLGLFLSFVLKGQELDILNEDFDDVVLGIPDGWNRDDYEMANPSYNWQYYSPGYGGEGKCVRFNSYTTAPGEWSRLKSPVFALTREQVFRFKFKNANGGDFSVYLSMDGGVTCTNLLESGLRSAEWVEREYSLSAYTGGENVCLVFECISNGGSGDAFVYLDDVVVEDIPLCSGPRMITLLSASQNSAFISWTLSGIGGEPEKYRLQIEDREATTTDTIEFAAEDLFYEIENLNSNTEYYVTLEAYCGVGKGWSDETEVLNFRTLCEKEALPLKAMFDDVVAGGVPECWIKEGNVVVQTAEKYGADGGALMLSSTKERGAIVVTPQLLHAADDLDLQMKIYGDKGVKFKVGLMSDPSLGETFEVLWEDSIKESGVWLDYRRPTLTSASYGDGDNVSLAISLDAGVVATLYVDSVVVLDAPSCMYLYDVYQETSDASSVTLAWSEYAEADGYEIEVLDIANTLIEGANLVNYSRKDGKVVGVIGSLVASMDYMIRVRGVCGSEQSEWSEWVSCRTMCEPREEAVFVESFAKGGIPLCWTSKQTIGVDNNGKLNYGDGAWYTTTSSSNINSTPAALMARKSYAGIHTVLASQAINIERAGMYDFRFWMKRLALNGTDVLQVWVNNRPDTVGGIKLATLHNDIDESPIVDKAGWYKYEYNIPLSGVTYIVFEAIANNISFFYIDDVEVFLAPTCRKVKDVEWVDATVDGGIVGWKKAAEETAWIVNAQCAMQGTGLNNAEVKEFRDTVWGTPRWVFSGLESATDYSVSGEVMAYCGGDDKGEAVAFSFDFMTDCEAVVEFPFVEGFEGEKFPPKCWEQWQIASPDVVDSTSQGWGRNTNLTNFINRGNASAQLYNRAEGYKHILVSPQFDFGEGGYRLSFWQYRNNGYTIKQKEGIRVLINDKPTTEGATELIYIKSNMLMSPEVYEAGFYKYKVDILAGGKQYLIFEGISEDHTSSFIDDIEISEIPECDDVSDFAVVDVLDTKVWVEMLDSTVGSWQLSYGEGVFLPEEGVIVDANSRVVEVSGLSSATTYGLYVRRVCGDKYGSWKEEKLEFTTLCSPIAVRANVEWFEGFEGYEAGRYIEGCYIQEYDDKTSRPLEASGRYEEVDWYSDNVTYVIEPKTGERFALATEYNSDNWMFAYVDLLAGENYEMSLMARHGDPGTNIGTTVSLAYGNRPTIDSMLTYIVSDVVVDGEWTQVIGAFRVEEDGQYFIGIHLKINDYYEKGGIDDLRLRVSNCVMPSSMSASRTTSSGAVLNVITLTDSIRIAVSDKMFDPVSEVANTYDAILGVNGTQYGIVGLQPDTKYYYSVCGICGDYTSDWLRVDSFETRCLSVDLPLYEGFENTDLFGCWSQVGTGVGEIETSSAHSGNSGYRINGNVLITPQLNVESLEDYMLTGWAYALDKNVSFSVGVMTDPNDLETFEPITSFTIHKRATWTEFFNFFGVLSAEDYANFRNAQYLAIVVPNDVDLYFDDLRIETAVDCPNPSGGVITNVTTTSCDLSWVVNGAEQEWGVRAYSSAGELKVDTIVRSNSITLGNLQSSMYYDIYVRALCSDLEESVETYVGGVRTLCKEVMPLPYFEGMEGVDYLNDLCFDYINRKEDYPSVNIDKYLFVMGGKQSLEMVMSKNEAVYLVMPEFELPTNKLRISFDYRNETADVRWNTDLVLGVIKDISDVSTFDTLKVCPMSSDSTRVYYYFDTLPEELANARIALKYGPGPINDRSCGIDNIFIEAIPGCIEPAQEMEIVELTDKSITIKIDGRGAIEWEVEFRKDGENSISTIVNQEEFTIQDLEPRTYYDVYVRSVCSEINKSEWVGPLSFRTNCQDGMETPWIETFEDYTDISESCFMTIGEDRYTNHTLATGKYANVGDKGMLLSLAQYKELYVVLPRFADKLSDLKIVFDYYSEEHDGVTGDLILGVMSDLSDKLTFKQMFVYGTTEEYVTVRETLENVGEEYDRGWIVFKWCNFREEWSTGPTYYAYCGLDNIKVESKAACFAPEDFDLIAVSDTSAVVVWSQLEGVESGEWQLESGETEKGEGEWEVVVGLSGVELNELSASTDYVLKVRTICSDTAYSDWVEFEFRTMPTPVELPYIYGFEDEEENKNWTLVNGTEMNRLVIGTDNEAVLSGDNSLYVSHDDSTYFYYFNYASDVHAYRPIYLEAGYYLSEFSWKCAGENTRDYGRLYLSPVTRDIVAGEYIATQAYVPDGCIAIDGGVHLNEAQDWKRSLVEFEVAESKFYNLVVSWHNSESGGALPPFAIDDIVIREATCLPVDSLQVVAKQDDKATIAFVADCLQYQGRLIGGGKDVELSFEGNEIDLIGLLSATTYEFSVRGICGEGDTSQWRSIEFITEKAAVEAPYSIGFEDGKDNQLWTITNTGNNAFIIGPTDEAVSAGDSALYVHSTQDSYSVSYNYVKNANFSYNTQYIYAYRLIKFEPGSYYIDYDWKCEGKENEDFGRVYLQATDDRQHSVGNGQLNANGVIELGDDVLYGNLDWTRSGGVLIVEDTIVYKLVVAWQNEVDGTYYTGPKPLAIDNIEVRKLNCNVVDSIKLLTLGDTYAEVGFVNLNEGGEVMYELAVKGVDSVVSRGVVVGESVMLTNLEANGTYSLYLKVKCDDGEESPARELTFTTTSYQYSLPYEADFEKDEENARWRFEHGIGSNKFVVNNDTNAVNRGEKALYVSSGDSLYKYVDYERNVTAYVSLTFDEPGEYVVNYDWKVRGESGSDYARVFLASTTQPLVEDTHYPYEELRSDFIPLDGGKGLCFDTAIWHNMTQVFELEKEGNYNFVVTWHNDRYINGTPPIAIDNVIVRKNSCKSVEKIEVYDVEDERAKVRVVAEDLSQVEYRVSLTHDPDLAFVTGEVSGGDIELEGLRPNAVQYLFVRVKCSDTDYSLWQQAEIKTYCDDIITITKTNSYIDKFEYTDLDPCWIVTSGDYATGKLSMLASLETTVLKATNDVDVVLTRPFRLEAGRRYELSLKSRQRELLEDARVGFVARRRGEEFDTLAEHQVTQAYQVYDATFTPTESGVYELGIRILTPWWCNNPTTYLLTVDDFAVREVLLSKPEDFKVDYLSSTEAEMSWIGDGLADSYEVQLLINGSVVRDTIVFAEAVSFERLKNSTQYDARVRGLLTQAGDSSSWAMLSFRTHCDVVRLPFRENFEDTGDNIPACWTLASNLTEDIRDWAVKETLNGNKVAQLSTSLANGYAILHTPLLFVDSDIYSLKFRYETNISDDEYLVVRISDDAGVTFADTVLFALRNNAWTDVEYDLSGYVGKTIMVEFKVRSLRDNSYSEIVSIDDVNIACRSANEIVYTDHICWGKHYTGYGFDVETDKLQFGVNRIEKLQESQVEGECDTMKVLNLHVDPAGTFYLNDTICPGDVYNEGAFAGYDLTTTGTYLSEPLTSSCGCDSIVRLYLVVQPKREVINDTICEGEVYEFAGKEITSTGIYVDTISYCEFRVLNLIVHPKYFEHGDTICEGTILDWEGMTLRETGRYEKIYRNQFGCDSIEVMNLWVIPEQVGLKETICQGTTYYFGGVERSEAGVYVDSLVNILGCDSIITLHLSVSKPSRSRFDDYVCEGYEYVGYGFRELGIEKDTLLSRTTSTLAGCDSIVEVFVEFVPTVVVDTLVRIVEGDYYEFGENTLTKSGVYTETFATWGTACDSVVNLTLEVLTGVDNIYTLPLIVAPNPILGGETTYVNRSWTADEQRGLRVEIVDGRGQIVQMFYPEDYPIAISGIEVRGVYLVRVISGTGETYLGKFIVR